MSKSYAVVKIDICGSKEYCEAHSHEHSNVRDYLLSRLSECVNIFYPYSDTSFPDGSFYSAQGDCIYLVLEKSTVALRSTIEFMKEWYSKLPHLPDCRAVIDYGLLDETTNLGRLELVGEVFENISVMEKNFNSGQIGVSFEMANRVDNTLVQFIKPMDIQITGKRQVKTMLANYDDPRLINFSSLAHALFIADPAGTNIRERTFEALIIELISEKKYSSVSFDEIDKFFNSKNCPSPGKIELDRIISLSKYLANENNNVTINEESKTTIDKVETEFIKSKQETVLEIIRKISDEIGISDKVIETKINIERLTEEYLCAVFLEIRMIANYFRSTSSVFKRLSTTHEFDYILKRHLQHILSDNIEEFIFIKRAFLESLRDLALNENIYIASIFHNVFMLYYLNRNSKYAHGQLAAIKSKEYYLDANAFYAYKCSSSNYHTLLKFSIEKLISLGCEFSIFDKSLQEYREALNYALRSKDPKEIDFFNSTYQPWIWQEFNSNQNKYRGDFKYCVMLHQVPMNLKDNVDFTTAETELKKKGIYLKSLVPFLEQEELGKLYNDVYEVKKKYDREAHMYLPKGSPETYHLIVLHDANCLNKLSHPCTNPFNAKELFITCDFSLSKIRKMSPDSFDFIITVPEFYEFMLPYMFMENLMTNSPVSYPNFILASTLQRELFQTPDFKRLFGDYLSENIDNIHEFKILEEYSNEKRFQGIKEKYKSLSDIPEENFENFMREITDDAINRFNEYTNKVKGEVANRLLEEELFDAKNKLDSTEKENIMLKRELDRIKKKQARTKKYKEAMKKRNKK